jgi:hypothetical protein
MSRYQFLGLVAILTFTWIWLRVIFPESEIWQWLDWSISNPPLPELTPARLMTLLTVLYAAYVVRKRR